MFKLLIISILLISLSACSTTKYQTLDVQQKEIQHITIPDHLLEPCKPEVPISKEEYLQFKPYEKERYLTNYVIYLLSTIKQCNNKLDKIREFNSLHN